MVSYRNPCFPVVLVDLPDHSKAHSRGRLASPCSPWHQPSYGRNSPFRMYAFMVAGSAIFLTGPVHRMFLTADSFSDAISFSFRFFGRAASHFGTCSFRVFVGHRFLFIRSAFVRLLRAPAPGMGKGHDQSPACAIIY